MRVVSLVVVSNKTVPLEFLAVFCVYLPIQECPERIALKKAVEEMANLFWSPNKLPLNCWEH